MCAIKLSYLKIIWSLYLLGLLEIINCVEAGPVEISSNGVDKRYYSTLPFEDCGSKYDILYLSISSCTKIPCQMQRGSKVTVQVVFDDEGKNTSYLKHHVRWVFNSIKTDALITPDPCDGYHDCIMNSSDGRSYWAFLYVNESLPVIGGHMIWEAEDEQNNQIICFKVPVAICT